MVVGGVTEAGSPGVASFQLSYASICGMGAVLVDGGRGSGSAAVDGSTEKKNRKREHRGSFITREPIISLGVLAPVKPA